MSQIALFNALDLPDIRQQKEEVYYRRVEADGTAPAHWQRIPNAISMSLDGYAAEFFAFERIEGMGLTICEARSGCEITLVPDLESAPDALRIRLAELIQKHPKSSTDPALAFYELVMHNVRKSGLSPRYK